MSISLSEKEDASPVGCGQLRLFPPSVKDFVAEGDAESQVIVGCSLSNRQNDHGELEPMIEQIEETLGKAPRELSAGRE